MGPWGASWQLGRWQYVGKRWLHDGCCRRHILGQESEIDQKKIGVGNLPRYQALFIKSNRPWHWTYEEGANRAERMVLDPLHEETSSIGGG